MLQIIVSLLLFLFLVERVFGLQFHEDRLPCLSENAKVVHLVRSIAVFMLQRKLRRHEVNALLETMGEDIREEEFHKEADPPFHRVRGKRPVTLDSVNQLRKQHFDSLLSRFPSASMIRSA
jgi:hypothetical protein